MPFYKPIFSAFIMLAVAAPALGVIQVFLPVSSLYDVSSLVVSGKVSGLDNERQVVEVTLEKTYKGETSARMMRIQFSQPAGLFAQMKQGQPVAILVSKGSAAIHLSDGWLLSTSGNPEQTIWRTMLPDRAKQLRQAYPGTTGGLLKLLSEIKGKHPILDKVDDALLRGGVEKVTQLKLNAPPVFIGSADFDADGKAELVIGGREGSHILWGKEGLQLKRQDDFTDLSRVAIGDFSSDGRPDVVIGDRVLVAEEDGVFRGAEGKTGGIGENALGVAIVDMNEDRRPDLVTITPAGELRVALRQETLGADWERQPARRLWKDQTAVGIAIGDFGDDGTPHAIVIMESQIVRYSLLHPELPPADFTRLTGEELTKFDPKQAGLEDAATVTLDANGDGRPDVLVLSKTGGVLLINRGYGAFFASLAAPAALREGGQSALPHIGHDLVWCGARLGEGQQEDLIIVTPEGEILRVKNPVGSVGRAPKP